MSMGDGKRLKEILDQKKMKVSDLAKITKMNKQTLYSIINRDYNIRYDFAFRIANALNIDISEICQTNPFEYTITMPELLHPKTEKGRTREKLNYAKNRMTVLTLFEADELPMINETLDNYYKLSDEGRNDVNNFIKALLPAKTDKKRETLLKKIK